MSYQQTNPDWSMYNSYNVGDFQNTDLNISFQANPEDDANQNSPFPMMYGSLPTIQNSTQDVTSQPQPPNSPNMMMRWARENREGPFYPGRTDVTSAPLQVDTVLGQQKYRNRIASDAASSNTGPPDSGYGTRPLNFVAGGDEPSSYNKECSPLEKGVRRMRGPRKTSRASSFLNVPIAKSEAKSVSQQSLSEESGATGFVCQHPNCGQTFKTGSELRKHRLKHERPYKCPITDCEMSLKGFTTTNDLDRHKVTKHHIFSTNTKAWSCAATGCKSKPRYWLRLDNFRHHIQKAHTEDDEEVKRIIANSIIILPATTQPPQGSQQTSDIPSDMFVENEDPSSVPYYNSYEPSEVDMFNDHFTAGSTGTAGDAYDDFGGLNDNSQSSYALPSDAAAFSPSTPDNAPSFSPTTPFPPATFNNLANNLSDNQFLPGSFSVPQSPWAPNAPTDTTLTQDQKQLSRKSSAASKPAVVITQEKLHLQTELETVVKKHLTPVELHHEVSNLLQLHAGQLPSGSLATDYQNTPRGGSLSPSRGRKYGVNGRSLYVTHGNNRKTERARSQMSDRSQSSNPRGRPAKQDNHSPARQLSCTHPGCEKQFQRQSALDKHIRRHAKPYACTFDVCPCSKIFGSKNDWKRHESSQHMQQDQWRCATCYQAFSDKRAFTQHLEEQHGVDDRAESAVISRESRIGVNHSGSFWCGFCREIKALDPNKRGVAAWDERFNHIAAHFVPDKEHQSEQCKIEDWLPPDGTLTKGQREQRSDMEPQEEDETYPQSAVEPNQVMVTQNGGGAASSYALPSQPQIVYPQAVRDNEQGHDGRSSRIRRTSSTKRRRTNSIICCQCGHTSTDVHVACEACETRFCDACLPSHVRHPEEAEYS